MSERKMIKCPCGAETEAADTRNLEEQAKATGFFGYMNVSNGLSVKWICPACDAHAKAAIHMLYDVFGEETRYIHILKQVLQEQKRRQAAKEAEEKLHPTATNPPGDPLRLGALFALQLLYKGGAMSADESNLWDLLVAGLDYSRSTDSQVPLAEIIDRVQKQLRGEIPIEDPKTSGLGAIGSCARVHMKGGACSECGRCSSCDKRRDSLKDVLKEMQKRGCALRDRAMTLRQKGNTGSDRFDKRADTWFEAAKVVETFIKEKGHA